MKHLSGVLAALIVLICSTNTFAQPLSYSSTPQVMQNCSPCSGDVWTFSAGTYGFPILFSNGGNSVSNQLYLTGFGFNIPAAATVKGVALSISTWSCMPEDYYDSNVQLLLNNVPSGSNKASMVNFLPYPNSNNIVYGNNTDLWGNTLTPAIVNANNFGATYEVTHTATSSSCFQLNGFHDIALLQFVPRPIIEVFYETITGVLEKQISSSSSIKAYSYNGKMYVANSSLEQIENSKIQIYNSLGSLVYEVQKTIAPNEIENLFISDVNAGFYFVTICNNKNELMFSKKLLIEKN